ncbi:MAG: hypothetical protein AAGK78_02570 [Planctomycetota bacterium]
MGALPTQRDPVVDERLLEDAALGKPDALREVLGLFYPEAYQTAVALTGRRKTGEDALATVMHQATQAAASWQRPDEPCRWFRHHTLLAVRARHATPPMGNDVLLGDHPSGAYRGFLVSMRKLHPQQTEAFLLHHGGGLSVRQLGIAMDCSVDAAAMHLENAQATLRSLGREQFLENVSRLRDVYRAIEPEGGMAVRLKRPSRLRRTWWKLRTLLPWVGMLLILLAVAGLVYAGYVIWPRLDV